MNAPAYSMQRYGALQMPGTERHKAAAILWAVIVGCWVESGVWGMAGSSQHITAKITLSVEMVIRTLSLAWPPSQDLSILQGHVLDDVSNYIFRKDRQFDLRESRSPTDISQPNQHPTYCRFCANGYIFGLGLMATIVGAPVMVILRVMVPKALSQVGLLCQCQCQSLNRPHPAICQSFHKLRVQSAQRFLRKCYSGSSLALSSAALSSAATWMPALCSQEQSQAGSQAGFQLGSQSGTRLCSQ